MNLESAVTYGGRRYAVDNADYRKARWKALCGDYFIMDTIFYHQIFTLFFCMMDNRAKNTFWGYSAVQDKWHLCFGYDFDTAMGNDNEGDMTRRYGYLDTDTIGNGHVFNGYDSVPFALNREVFATELRSMYAICEAGRAKDFFAVGAKIKLLPGAGSTITDSSIIFQVFGYNHFKISDTNNFANVVFGMLGILNQYRQMNSGSTNVGGFDASAMKTWLNGTMLGNLSKPWQALIKTVDVLASKGGTNYDILTSRCKLFLFADPEVGFNKTAAPYMNEVDPGAETLQLPIFTDNASRIKKAANGTGSANGWVLRSATASNTSNFENVYGNGGAGNYNANVSNGVCFGFCI